IPNARERIRAMSLNGFRSLVFHAVVNCETERLAKAVCGLADGSLTVQVTKQSDTEVCGSARNGDGKGYAVSLTADRASCSCPDSLFRHNLCKHTVALALTVLRTPAQAQQYHLGDEVKHQGQTGKVVAVSGEFISVWWNSGRTFPLTREQLTT